MLGTVCTVLPLSHVSQYAPTCMEQIASVAAAGECIVFPTLLILEWPAARGQPRRLVLSAWTTPRSAP